ncbi:hypothetical protein [Azovibrio restrictus]|uniref:hypothetical protein n=1 Tax=Azovibrio restrictus TaxID=146938 RepID=UPI0026ECA82D|nr:hypothetical protein [Azovibrio restrictus]MDD3483494.1 hypothetical protein [Azovibrio restrictus]
MQGFNRGRQRLVALALLGLVLLTPPLLNTQAGTSGLEVFLYLFGVWAGLILAAAWVAERQD